MALEKGTRLLCHGHWLILVKQSKRLKMRRLPNHVGPETKPNGPREKTQWAQLLVEPLRNTLRSKT
jgi:hypothetical protein